MLRPLLFVLAIAATPVAQAAEPASGMIEICRISQAGNQYVGKAIEIPVGSSFGDTGDGIDHRTAYWPLWIATTQALTIEGADRCGSTHARITGNVDRRPVRIVDHRWFTPSVGEANGRAGWPGDLPLAATALSDFK